MMEWFSIFFEWQGATPLAITISTLVAVLAILSAKDVTKRKNSIDILFATKHDDRFIDGIDVIRNVHINSKDDIRLYAEELRRNDETAKTIRYVLNLFEHISIGIKRDIYDENITKRTIRNMMVSIWGWTSPYVLRRRGLGHRKAYVEYQKLIWRWTTPWYKKPLTFCHKIPHIAN